MPTKRKHVEEGEPNKIGAGGIEDRITVEECPAETSGSEPEILESAGSDEETVVSEEEGEVSIWRPGVEKLGPDEVLDYDPSAYDIFYKFRLGWPCLSVDFVHREQEATEGQEGLTAYLVAGTQADRTDANSIFTVRASGLVGEDESEDEEDDDEVEAKLDFSCVNVPFVVNSIRACPQVEFLVACLGDDRSLNVYSIQDNLRQLDNPKRFAHNNTKPLFSHRDHLQEGFALDWDPNNTGVLASGSRDNRIILLQPIQGGWTRGAVLEGHTGGVEGISFGPNSILASGSSDGTVKLWDLKTSQCTMTLSEGHVGDVNVVKILDTHLISGGDDGKVIVRDTRFPTTPIAMLHFHKEPVAAIDWHPSDPSQFLAGSYDDTVTVWDLSLEEDPEDAQPDTGYPVQMLFHHMGLCQATGARWHPKIAGFFAVTDANGIQLVKPENL